MRKITIRIPTQNQYAFVEEEVEFTDEAKAEDVKERYDALYGAMNSNQKVNDTQFIKDITDIVKNNMVMEGEEAIEYHESLTPLQKELAKQIKLYGNRLINKYKPEK